MEIGPQLRAARAARKLSLRALGALTGFSPSFLSQVELGQSSPSLASLSRICEALETDLAELLRGPVPPRAPSVVRRADRAALRSEWSKASAEALLPARGDERLSALLLSLDPGGQTGALPAPGPGHELAYCIQGDVLLNLGSEHYDLSTGDSVLITGGNAAWENRGSNRAQILVVSVRHY